MFTDQTRRLVAISVEKRPAAGLAGPGRLLRQATSYIM